MQAVDVAKDVAAEREAAHHGLLLALGDWRPDWCIQNQRREPTESVRAIDSTVFHDGICKQHDSSPLKISAHHCRVGLLQCRILVSWAMTFRAANRSTFSATTDVEHFRSGPKG